MQECLTPEIRVRDKTGADGATGHVGGTRATIRSVSWVRMRCIVVVEAFGAPVSVDLRLSGAAAESVALAPKSPDDDGIARLVLADDDHEDAALVVIVTDADGRILAQQPTRKGGRP